jgi:molybdopterin molybdotransferase
VKPLLHWEAARTRVLDGVRALAPVTRAVLDSRGYALAEDVTARESMPSFDNSAMDGFGVRAADVAAASQASPAILRIVGTVAAGASELPRVGPAEAARIMTGAAIPPGVDAVVPVELTDTWDSERRMSRTPESMADPARVRVFTPVWPGDHVRRAGESVAAGALVLSRGERLGPAQIAMLLSAGVFETAVHPLPRVGVISTGDELVTDAAPLRAGQIRDSNRPGLLAAIADEGFVGVDLGAAHDDADEIEQRVLDGIGRVDFLLTSGGVSVGDFDITRRVLGRIGEVEAYGVAVKPGRPQLFGTVNGVPVFGLPGNAVSSLVVFDQFVLPALKKMAGRRDLFRPIFPARLDEPIGPTPDRVQFVRIRLECRDGEWIAFNTGPQGSGILSSMARANGYAILPAGGEPFAAGTPVPCQLLTRA